MPDPAATFRDALLRLLTPTSGPPVIGAQDDSAMASVIEQMQTVPEIKAMLEHVPAIGTYRVPGGVNQQIKERLGPGGVSFSASLVPGHGGPIAIDLNTAQEDPLGSSGWKYEAPNPNRQKAQYLRDVMLHELGHTRQGVESRPLQNDEDADYYRQKYGMLLTRRYNMADPPITGQDIDLSGK